MGAQQPHLPHLDLGVPRRQNGAIPLTSIQIGSFLNGNVIAGQTNVGKALGLGMVVIIAIAMLIYVVLQRRAAKWLQ